MNKPQYLAELSQLLIFMTRADRERTLDRYGALFDAAGPEGQDALLQKLGSTTRQAIRLSRIYDAEGYKDELLDALEKAPAAPAPKPAQEAAPAQKPEAEQLAALMEDDLPQFDLDDLPDLTALPDEPPAPPAPEKPAPPVQPPAEPEKPAPEPEAGAMEEQEEQADPDEYEELWGKRPQTPKKAAPDAKAEEETSQPPAETEEEPAPKPAAHQPPAYTVERVVPLWAGVPLFVLTVIFLVVPLAGLCLLLIPTLLLPGLAILLGAVLAVIGGLWCISIVADAAVLFGAALILLALGMLVLWWGLWLDVGMVTGFVRALQGLAHLTLGKKVTVHA